MDSKFFYSVGNAMEVITGRLERFENVNDLPEKKSTIILPKFVGVYHEIPIPMDRQNQVNAISDAYAMHLFEQDEEPMSPELICLGFNPTFYKIEDMNKILEHCNPWQRIKFLEIDLLKQVKFKKKQSFHEDFAKAMKMSDEDPSLRPFSAKAIQIQKTNREIYGLRRDEATELFSLSERLFPSEYRRDLYEKISDPLHKIPPEYLITPLSKITVC